MSEQTKQKAPAGTSAVVAYEPPAAVRAGSLTSLAEGSFSTGQSDDGDYYTTKWQ
ncbi:hypothetical protein [Streptomyces sp. NPDC059278]|uniref:hypothetical protein n=1 Tax=Streptomyces sp. NPDC059278 TaxID=3346801 RepID=UPI003693DA67